MTFDPNWNYIYCLLTVMINDKFGNFNIPTCGETCLFANPSFRRTDYNRGIIWADASFCLNVQFMKGSKEIGEYRRVLVKQYMYKYTQIYTKWDLQSVYKW